MNAQLKQRLEPIAEMQRRLAYWRGWVCCWAAAAAVVAGLLVAQRALGWAAANGVLLVWLLAVAGCLVLRWRARQIPVDYRAAARAVEEEHPDLGSLLLAAVEQTPEADGGGLGFLQERVVQEAVAHGERARWGAQLNERLLRVQCGCLAVFGLCIGLYSFAGRPATATAAGPTVKRAAKAGVAVTPGDAAVERGSGVVVLAEFSGPVPAEATLVITTAEGRQRRVPLAKNLADPVFGGTLPEVTADLSYRIEYGGEQTREFRLSVFEHPRLERADAQLTYPAYTGLAPKQIADTRRVTAVEGTTLEYTFKLNKPVTGARLLARDKSVIDLRPDAAGVAMLHLKATLAQSQRYELQLVDAAGRTNKVPAEVVVEVTRNRPPQLKLASPRGDARFSPIQEISFQGEAWDDFGLKDFGVAYTVAGQETKMISMGTNSVPGEKRPFTHLLALEGLGLQPDQLVTFYLWADDVGPDGQVRRTASDIYFGEIRPFEEIFREDESGAKPPKEGGGGGQGEEAEKLAELQKQIIVATWKIQGRETGAKVSGAFSNDVTVVRESQEKAVAQVEALLEKAGNEKTKKFAEAAQREMERAVDQLNAATKDNAARPLGAAVTAETAAYQALLKLQAHEYMVSKGQRSSGKGKGKGGAQSQIDQLDLKQAENRYETQKQAGAQPEDPGKQEQLQVLNRLRELARRQEDINEKLKELQTALQEAKTEAEREEMQRRLKRLREEQQEMVKDIDELKQRMEKQENQATMADARKQLDETRDEAQKASQQLDDGKTAQALSAGTRAQRELQELRDEFRKKNSKQFSEEMRQLRNEARQLAQNQEDIAQKLQSVGEPKRRSLTDSNERQELQTQLAQQKSALTNLTQNMRQVTEQAETAEPLLSKQLYDTLRKTGQENLDRSLDITAELVKRGFVPQAGEPEKQARKGINELKQGVEKAAESVLGDEASSLKSARRELDDLLEKVEREMAAATGRKGDGAKAGGRDDQKADGGQTGQRADAGKGEKGKDDGKGDGEKEGKRDDAKPGQGQGKAKGEGKGESQKGEDEGKKEGKGNGKPGEKGEGKGDASKAEGGKGEGKGTGKGEGKDGEKGEGKNQGKGDGKGDDERGEGKGEGKGQGGQGESGQPSGSNPAGGQQAGGAQRGGNQNQANRGGQRSGAQADGGNFFGGDNGGLIGEENAPVLGGGFVEWSDRLRNVEEMLDAPDLRNQVAVARDRMRAMRAEFKKHGKKPDWAQVKTEVAQPLAEVRSKISDELARRESKDALVPIDRDPVPNRFSDLVRRYYEQLGGSK